MKALIRNHKTLALSELPELAGLSFKYGELIGHSGSILKRALKGGGPLSHYAVFLGFDNDGVLWMLENNEHGVECVTWGDFLSEATDFEFVHIEPNSQRIKEILMRANERSSLEYDVQLNNCEHFANYCVHGNFNSDQVKVFTKLVDAALSLFELTAATQQDPVLRGVLHDYNELRKLLHVDRTNTKLQEIINKRIPPND